MIVTAESLVITSCDERTSAKSGNPYLSIRVEDPAGYTTSLMDRNLDNKDRYQIGRTADFKLCLVSTRAYTSISVRDFTIKDEN